MSYKLTKMIVPPGLKNNPNKNMAAIKYITIHTTGNAAPTATAESHAKYQYGGSGGTQSSWHYTVDKDGVYQSFEDKSMCWHCGDGNGDGNAASIGIEICVNDKGSFWVACDTAAQLTADLLKKHGLTLNSVVQHNFWTGKDCPKELRAGDWGVNWAQFLSKVKGYVTPEPLPNTPSDWAKDAWAWGVSKGITDGTNPRDTCTREQVVAMIARALNK